MLYRIKQYVIPDDEIFLHILVKFVNIPVCITSLCPTLHFCHYKIQHTLLQLLT